MYTPHFPNRHIATSTATSAVTTHTTSSSNAPTLSNQKLYELCTHYGKLALHYRRKFIGLLPEVNRRRLYEQKGFNSIYEFAAKLAGVSREQVDIVLCLEKRFEDKPELKKTLIQGEISVNKLAKIVSIATAENDRLLVEQAKLLSSRALETLVQDIKWDFKPKIPTKSLHVQTLELAPDVEYELIELQQKGIDVNQFLRETLQNRRLEIAREKEKLGTFCETKVTRHIPAKIRKIVHAEHGTKCAIAHCQKPSQTIHHTARFAIAKNHDPHFLAPLCREHHQIAHSIDQKFTSHRSP